MLAVGQRVECVTVNESMCSLKLRRMVEGRIIYINRPNRWFLVKYRGQRGAVMREGYSFYDIGRVVFAKKRRKRS